MCFVRTDPRLWTEAQAAHWFWWAYREFSVPEPPPTPLLRRVVCGGSQFQKFAAGPNAIVARSSGQVVRERARRGRRRLRSNANKSPTCSSNEDDGDDNDDGDGGADRDDPPQGVVDNDDDDDDELISSSSGNNNRPLYARKGRHLCNMGRERFVAEAPPFLGDILWEHLEMMQRGERCKYIIVIVFILYSPFPTVAYLQRGAGNNSRGWHLSSVTTRVWIF